MLRRLSILLLLSEDKLSKEVKKFIDEQMQSPSASDFVNYVISAYSQQESCDVLVLMDTINQIVKQRLCEEHLKVRRYSFITNCLMVDHKPLPIEEAKSNFEYVMRMLHTCSVHFPEGLTGSESAAEFDYFTEMITLLSSRPNKFEYDKPSFWQWASQYGMDVWLSKIIVKYIDAENTYALSILKEML